MNFKLLSTVLLITCLTACSGNQETEAERRAELLKDPEGARRSEPDLLATVPFKTLPLVDSTNFDNFTGEDKLSEKLVSMLSLKSIDPNFEYFHSRYRIAHTTAVDMIVITASGENELKTFLISYSKEDYRIIDKILIAYDEIAESAFSATGKISKGKVVVSNYNYLEEKPRIEINQYRIESSGKFTRIKS